MRTPLIMLPFCKDQHLETAKRICKGQQHYGMHNEHTVRTWKGQSYIYPMRINNNQWSVSLRCICTAVKGFEWRGSGAKTQLSTVSLITDPQEEKVQPNALV